MPFGPSSLGLITWCWDAVWRLFFGDFLLAPQKKVTPLPGGTPGISLTG
jgi:hypothetical protein